MKDPFAANYEIHSKLGQGGMGEVYKATDRRLGRSVALKFLRSDEAASEKDRERFRREAIAASSLDHPNICTIHEIGESDDGELFIVMAYYEGQTLRHFVKQEPPSISTAVELGCQIAEGLRKAHANHVVHRDIKPGNLILTPDGIVKILDFGLARMDHNTAITETGQVVGTVSYMAPEQIKGERVDHQTDIWALGVVIYELITGERPFSGNAGRVVHLINSADPEPIESFRPDAPSELSQCVCKAIQRERSERYQHVGDFLNDLRKVQSLLSNAGPQMIADVQPQDETVSMHSVTSHHVEPLRGVAEPAVSPTTSPTPELQISTLAVLPFEDISAERRPNDFFADGLTEELIHALSIQKQVRVISRNSVHEMTRKNVELSEIREVLGVDAVIEGTIRRSGDRVRVVARLVDTKGGDQIWSEKYDRQVADAFELQDEIVAKIHHRLEIELESQKGLQKRAAYQGDMETYSLYLKGRHFWHKRDLERSREYYEKAIERDADFALSHAGLAYYHASMGVYGGGDPRDVWPLVRAQVLRALELDYQLPDAHIALGFLRTFADWDWKAAGRAFQEAVHMAPSEPETSLSLAMHLIQTGQLEEAFRRFEMTKNLDPLSPFVNAFEVGLLVYARRYDDAIVHYREAVALGETLDTHLFGAMALQGAGQFDEALVQLEKIYELSQQNPMMAGFLGHCYGATDQKEKAVGLLNALDEQPDGRYVAPTSKAIIHAAIGNLDTAFEAMEQACEIRDTLLCYAKVLPAFDPLRRDSRFQSFLDRMGLGSDSSGIPLPPN